jgi:hypothetical protein
MKLIIMCGEGPVAELEDYTGPIPRVGEYIERPPLPGPRPGSSRVMSVKSVTYGILRRPALGGFGPEGDPWAEVWV